MLLGVVVSSCVFFLFHTYCNATLHWESKVPRLMSDPIGAPFCDPGACFSAPVGAPFVTPGHVVVHRSGHQIVTQAGHLLVTLGHVLVPRARLWIGARK